MNIPVREFSAKVEIELHVDGVVIPVRHLAREFIITSHPFQVNPTHGTVVLKIEDAVQKMNVFLTEGIDPSRSEQPVVMKIASWS